MSLSTPVSVSAFRKGVLFLLATVSLASCGMLKPGGGGRAGKLFEVFYAGEKGTLYFIKPLEFRSGDARLWMDYTFHYRPDSSGDALVNFTLHDVRLYRHLDTANLLAPGFSTSLQHMKLLYNQKEHPGFDSRFSAQLPMMDLYTYLNAANQSILTANQRANANQIDRRHVWQPTPKTQRRIRLLQENLLVLMAPDTAAMANPAE